ncbi:RES domain-containing protein [Steroidobacter flavus]|uniref:RES domain-containing protein n=1 Tax=Steroidobacter flavus TaxID=1842136 RepID=A0ABV8T766_9GAMM
MAGLAGGALTPTLLDTLTGNTSTDRDSLTSYQYSLTGKVSSIRTAVTANPTSDRLTTFTYNAFGENDVKLEVFDSTRTPRTEYKYDKRGQLTLTRWDSAAGGLDTSEARTYDAFGHLRTVTDARSNVSSRFEYDRLGQQTASIDFNTADRTVTSYDAFGRVFNVYDPYNRLTTYRYDEANRLMIVTTPESIVIGTEFNRHGQVLEVRAAGGTTTYSYDRDGQLTHVSDDRGTLESRSYDSGGRQITTTDANGVVTRFTYDAANRVLSRIEDVGGLSLTTTYTYDGLGRVTAVVEPSGRRTDTTYYRDGSIEQTVVANGSEPITTRYVYDRAGHVLTMTEGYDSDNPRVTEYRYDNLGRVTHEIVDPGSGFHANGQPILNLTTRYFYDDNGNLTRKIDGEQNSTWYVYDEDNRLTHTIDALGGVTITKYDYEDRVIETRRIATALPLETRNTLAGLNEVTLANFSVTETGADRTQQTVYDLDGRGRFSIDAMGGVIERTFDDNGNVTRERAYAARVPVIPYTSVSQVVIALGSAVVDNIQAEDRVQWTAYDLRGQATFTVDASGAVVRFVYDENGNITSKTAYATKIATSGTLSNGVLETWADQPANRDVEHDRVTRYWYDATGRLRYTLDAQGYVTELRYNDAGREDKKIVYAAPQTIPSGATTANIGTSIALTPTADQTTTTTYDAAGRVSRVTDASVQGYYEEYTYDALGNKLSYRNKLGATWHYVYDANGRLKEEHSPPVLVTRFDDSDSAVSAGPPHSFVIVTRMEYDDLGNVISRTEGILRDVNNPLIEDASDARTTDYEYDELGRQTATVFPEVGVYADTAGDAMFTNITRTETRVRLRNEVGYDVFGNAWRNEDVTGNVSYKLYDRLGRVTKDIDALGYVTSYEYDTFGNQTSLTRHAAAMTGPQPTSGASTIAVAVNSATDRTITKTYDRLNRVRSVIEPETYIFQTSSGANYAGTGDDAGATTVFQYNAFGDIELESRLIVDSTYARTYYYYDRMGRKTAQIDAEGYLTTFEYDETGDLKGQVEFATRITSAITTTSYTPPAPSNSDRHAVFVYDKLNRLIEERHSITYSAFANDNAGAALNEQQGNDVTEYGYDAMGNKTRVAVNGAETLTYYDELGRIRGVVEPERNRGDGEVIRPVTVTNRDAFGNAVRTIQYAQDATLTSNDFAVNGSALDRTTLMSYDSLNRVTHAVDPTGAHRYASYTARGDAAKEWQPVVNNDSVTEFVVTLYDYDALGRQTTITEPQSLGTGGSTVVRTSVYNAFGEVTLKTINGVAHESFEYDRAGRVWRTNGGDGVTKLYLYNLAGQATVEIRSQSHDLSVSSVTVDSLRGNLASYEPMRVETVYDKLGRILEKREVQFDADSLVEASTGTFELIDANPWVFLQFNHDRPNDQVKLLYRALGSTGAWLDGPEVQYIGGVLWRADVSSLLGEHEYKVTFTTPGASSYYAFHTGTFEVEASSPANTLELTPNTTTAARNLSMTAAGPVVTATWSPESTGNQAFFQMSLDGVNWYSAQAGLSGGMWVATLNNIADNNNWQYRVVENVNGLPLTMSSGTLEKQGATLERNITGINSQGYQFAYIDPADVTVGASAQNVDAVFNWSTASVIDDWQFRWRPYVPGQSPTTGWTTTNNGSLANLPPGDYQFQLTIWTTIYEFDQPPRLDVSNNTTGMFRVANGGVSVIQQTYQYGMADLVVQSVNPHTALAPVTISWPGVGFGSYFDKIGYKIVGTEGHPANFPNKGLAPTSGVVQTTLQVGQTYDVIIERWRISNDTFPPSEVFESTYTFRFTVVPGTNPSLQYVSTTIPFIGPATVDPTNRSVLTFPRPTRPNSTVKISFTGGGNSYSYDVVVPAPGNLCTVDLDALNLPPGFTYVFRIDYYQSGNWYGNNAGEFVLSQAATGPGKVTLHPGTLDQVTGLQQIFDNSGRALLYWPSPANALGSDQIQFVVYVQDPNHPNNPPVAQTITRLPWDRDGNGTNDGWVVDLSALPATNHRYELTYKRSGSGIPYRIASGIVAVYLPTLTGGDFTDTTSSAPELLPTAVTPLFQQSLDRWGNVLSYTQAAQTSAAQTTTYVYNQRNQVTHVTLPSVSVVSTINGIVSAPVSDNPESSNYYDRQGRLIATVDPNGNRNRIWYNAAGQVLKEQQAELTGITGTASGAKQYVYNAFGEQIQITDALGYKTRLRYDAGGRLRWTSQEVVAGAFAAADGSADPNDILETFNYAIDQTNIVTIAYGYDQAGRRITETTGEMMSGSTAAETVRYWYDLQGNLIRRRLPMGAGYETTYSYDPYGNGKKTRETDAIGGTQNWSYDTFGRLQTYTDIHGEINGSAIGSTTTYQYNYAGLLEHQTSTYGQDITYDYDDAGRVISIIENSHGTPEGNNQFLEDVVRSSFYSYDAAGRRTRERVIVNGHEYQDTIVSYDALGRISNLQDARYTTTYEYDAAGNRTHIESYYADGAGMTHDDLWYTYDGANRVTISQGGVNAQGRVDAIVTNQGIMLRQGVKLGYNAAGQRIESQQAGPSYVINEQTGYLETIEESTYTAYYKYDGLGRLTRESRMPDGGAYTGSPLNELWNERTYDRASRLVEQHVKSIVGNTISRRDSVMQYDDNGRIATQTSRVLDFSTGNYEPVDSTVTYGQSTFTNGTWSNGFDAAGNLRGYEVTVDDDTTNYFYKYRSGTAYQETAHGDDGGDGAGGLQGGSTLRRYNLNGELIAFVDEHAHGKDRYFVNNAEGAAIKVIQGNYTSSSSAAFQAAMEGNNHADKPQHQLMFDGKQIGTLQSIGGEFLANFDVNYTPISEDYPSSTPSQVVVQKDDTLRLIAARIWGDGNLWYVIADANGLQDGPDAMLTPGELLQIPNEVVSLSNTSGTFKPFDINAVLGDTTPSQPAPPPPKNGGGCGIVGVILVVVVAIVVSVVTYGALSGEMSAWAAGAIAGAAGSVASQFTGMLTGVQDGFDWKGVALGALGGGIAAGLGSSTTWANAIKDMPAWAQTAVTAAASSALAQGIAVATDLQEKFSWRAVAAAAVAAPIARGIGIAAGGSDTFPGQVLSALAGSVTRQAITNKGHVDGVGVAADVFGNLLGNSMLAVIAPNAPRFNDSRSGNQGQQPSGGGGAPAPTSATAGTSLTNNPANAIYHSAATSSSSGSTYQFSLNNTRMDGVLVTAPTWKLGEEFIYERLVSMFGYDGDRAAARAQSLYNHDIRLRDRVTNPLPAMLKGMANQLVQPVLQVADLGLVGRGLVQNKFSDWSHGWVPRFEAQDYFVSDVGRAAANGAGISETLPLGLQSSTLGSVGYHSYSATTNVMAGNYLDAAFDTGMVGLNFLGAGGITTAPTVLGRLEPKLSPQMFHGLEMNEGVRVVGQRPALNIDDVVKDGALPEATTLDSDLYRSVKVGHDPVFIHPKTVEANHRYSGPGQSGIYFSTEAHVAEAEVTHNGGSLVGRETHLFPDQSVPELLDLTNPAVRESLGVDLKDLLRTGGTRAWRYEVTHKVGIWAQQNGYRGIIAYSAQVNGGKNLVLFSSQGIVK